MFPCTRLRKRTQQVHLCRVLVDISITSITDTYPEIWKPGSRRNQALPLPPDPLAFLYQSVIHNLCLGAQT